MLHIYKEGPAELKGEDLNVDAEIEVINKDQYICTIDEGGKFDVELTVGRGRGYRPAKENKQPVIDYIAIDSIYTPVQKVNYTVEPTRVGQAVDYDKLTLEVWTDGTFPARKLFPLRRNHAGSHQSVRQSFRHDQRHGYPCQDGGRQTAAGSQNGDRGDGSFRPLVQLPEESEYSYGRRLDQKDGRRYAEGEKPRQKISGRSHSEIGVLRSLIK